LHGLASGLHWVDADEKGIYRNLEATLIQDWKPMRNLDSKINFLDSFVSNSTSLLRRLFDSIGKNVKNSD
jgi:hypothetical protein